MRTSLSLIFLTALLVAIAVPAAAAPAQSRQISVLIDGKVVSWDDSPIIVDGRTLVPMRALFEALKTPVRWDQTKKEATATKDGANIVIRAGDSRAWVNGQLVRLDVPAVILNGRMYIPLRFIAESLGAHVTWDAQHRVIVIRFPDAEKDFSLSYEARYVKDDNTQRHRLELTVTNNTNKVQTIEFNSGQTHDFVLERDGRVVWRASDGQVFTQALWVERIAPGEKKTYASELPDLAPGAYKARAYFLGDSREEPVAFLQFTIDWPKVEKALGYSLIYLAPEGRQPGRLELVVSNNTGRAQALRFASGKTHDFVLERDGRVVWRASDGQMYTQAVWTDSLVHGDTRTYSSELPDLAPGTYKATAYFMGQSAKRPVATAYITIKKANLSHLLKYSLSYRTGSMLNATARLVFEIRNDTKEDVPVYFPGNEAYSVIIKDAAGNEVHRRSIPRYESSGGTEIIGKGGAKYHFFNLPSLGPGNYTAYVYYPPMGHEPVAAAGFRI